MYKYIKILLIILTLLVGATAVFGGYKLITQNGLGMPLSLLSGSPFSSFVIPALILAFIVGGTQIVAAYLLVRKQKFALEAATIAGFGLLIWTFTELYMLKHSLWLQAVYFGIAILELVCVMLLLKYGKHYR